MAFETLPSGVATPAGRAAARVHLQAAAAELERALRACRGMADPLYMPVLGAWSAAERALEALTINVEGEQQ